MRNLTQESSSRRYQTSKTRSLFGAFLLVLILFIGFMQEQVNAVVIGVNPVTDFVIGSPVIESFNEATWTSISGPIALTMPPFKVLGAQSVTWNSDNHKFYAIIRAEGSIPSPRYLATVDPATGICTAIGEMGAQYSSLTYNSDLGILYAMGGHGAGVGFAQCLFRVDITTGATTFLGGPYPVGTFGEVIAYNYDDDLIYHWSGGDAANMETIDPVTFLASLPIIQTGAIHSEIQGAVYKGGGVFVATDLFFKESTNGYTITSTGVVTLVAPTPFQVRGLGYVNPELLPVLNLKALIQGFYNPITNKMAKDTARIYLRSTSSPYSIVDSGKAVLDSNGMGNFTFPNAVNSVPYYIVIRHRNGLETWSATGNSFTSGNLSYDFTLSSNQAFGNNQILKGTKYCIYNGDVNQDGIIDGSDAATIDNDAFNFATGYLITDLNGDQIIDGSDAAIADDNVFNLVAKITP